MPQVKLITKAEWDNLRPRTQGYLSFWQRGLPGSELKNVTCPYPIGSKEAKEYANGEFEGVMEVQNGQE